MVFGYIPPVETLVNEDADRDSESSQGQAKVIELSEVSGKDQATTMTS